MQRAGLVRAGTMMAVAAAPRLEPGEITIEPPWKTHWSVTCQHDPVARLKKSAAGTRAKMQCRKCGKGIGGNVPVRGVAEMWDDELERRVNNDYKTACDRYQEDLKRLRNEALIENSEAWWEAYSAYLKTSVWQAKRLMVLERARHRCECCGENEARQVHHTKYPQTFGLEPLWDLRAICIDCHRILHPHME